MYRYKDNIILNKNFNKSTNIIYDKANCENYILTTSSKNILKVFFDEGSENSIAIIGSFGCGKSSFLLYLNSILSNNSKCVDKLKNTDLELYENYKKHTSRNYFHLKIVGESISFKAKLKNEILNFTNLENSCDYLNQNSNYQLTTLLKKIDLDIEKSNFDSFLFSIDEFGKFIDFALENSNDSEIFDLQTIAEFVNKKNNYKLIVALHKNFKSYLNTTSTVNYSDWEKIQGRFEHIIFQDDFYEMLNIFKNSIDCKNTSIIEEGKTLISNICNSFTQNRNMSYSIESFKELVPLHPFSILVISDLFTKYFQNQRSIYSFLFSKEPFAFSEFINYEYNQTRLYNLTILYDYITYLLKIYNIHLPDSEAWYLSIQNIKNSSFSNIEIDLIKTISLIDSFKLNYLIKINKNNLILSLNSIYNSKEIELTLNSLIKKDILILKNKSDEYSLIAESNININREFIDELSSLGKIDLDKKVNDFIKHKNIIAKRFFSKYGNNKSFTKIYVDKNKNILQQKYKIFILNSLNFNNLLKLSKNNPKSLFINIDNSVKIENFIKNIEALNVILDKKNTIITSKTREIIENMMNDNIVSLENLLKKEMGLNKIFHNNKKYDFSLKNIQQLISEIFEKQYSLTPIINNYTFIHSIAKGHLTSIIKRLFIFMLEKNNLQSLGFESDKYPPEKALYLSVIKPSGMHQKVNNIWILTKPKNLNFDKIWDFLEKTLKEKIGVDKLIEKLSNEPFGLNAQSSLFFISLFIITNHSFVSIFRDNTYKYQLDIDLIMNMFKAYKKYELQYIKLNKKEQEIFKIYLTIINDISNTTYSKGNIQKIIKTLYLNFDKLPEYAKNSQNLSQKAKNLRSALLSAKEPYQTFFTLFPKALGYDNIEQINKDKFIKEFKNSFNEIVLSYKLLISDLENYIAKAFLLEHTSFPYGSESINLSDKFLKMPLDREERAFIQNFKYSNSLIEFIDTTSVIFNNKKITQSYDNEIIILKEKISNCADKLLSKLDILQLSSKNTIKTRVIVTKKDKIINKIVSIDKKRADILNLNLIELKKLLLTQNLSKNEKLYIISQLFEEEAELEK